MSDNGAIEVGEVLERFQLLIVWVSTFVNIRRMIAFCFVSARLGVGNCFGLRAASWSRKLAEGRTF